MSLYAVMEPVVAYGQCHWARAGAPTQNLTVADKRAHEKNGRVVDLDAGNKVIADFYVEPEPAPTVSRAEYRQSRAMAQLFA